MNIFWISNGFLALKLFLQGFKDPIYRKRREQFTNIAMSYK